MFSLIVTVISVALVVALVVAVLYHGGDTVTQGRAAADAATYETQSGQLLGAMDIYAATNHRYPDTPQDLITGRQLSSLPQIEITGSGGQSQVTSWAMPTAGQPVVAISPVPLAACKSFNKMQFGVDKVLMAPHTEQPASCFGPDAEHLTILRTKSASGMTAGMASLNLGFAAVTTPIPAATSTDTSLNGWMPETGAAPAQPATGGTFVADAFTGADGTLIHSHAPDAGGQWIRSYDLRYGYAYSDVNMTLTGNALSLADWSGSLNDHIILNQAVATNSDYEVSYDVKVMPAASAPLELYIAARSFFDVDGYPDGIFGYIYLDNSGNSTVNLRGFQTQGSLYVDIPAIKPTPGTHNIKLAVAGDTASLYIDNVLVQQRTVPGYSAGQVGFSMRHDDDLQNYSIDNFIAK